MFNIQGSEMIFLLLIALIVLGPEKLPDAVRKFARAYTEFKKMANGFQGELRSALDEPMRELRETAEAMKTAADFDLGGVLKAAGDTAASAVSAADTVTPTPLRKEEGLNFGTLAPRQREEAAPADAAAVDAPAPAVEPAPAEQPKGGLNFGHTTARTTRAPRNPLAAAEDGAS